jgi:hypothetical protein
MSLLSSVGRTHWKREHMSYQVKQFNYKPAERAKYIEAFFSNIDWSAGEKRLQRERVGYALPV